MKRSSIGPAVLVLCTSLAQGTAWAAQSAFTHVKSIDLGTVFNSGSGYGSNPLSLAFDGTNAYVGGFNNSGAAGNIGVVKIENVVGPGVLNTNALASTQFSSPNGRGLDALAYDASTSALIMSHDSGAAASSFISRRQASDGAVGASGWTTSNPQGARPFAMAVDPLGDAGSPGVAFLTQGSGRRRLLSLTTGATVFDGTNGGIINTSPDSGSTWRTIAFDASGNVVVANQSAYGYGQRLGNNQWQTLAAAPNLTTRSILKSAVVNNVGQGIAIMPGLGSDLLAFSSRGASQSLTDSAGGVGAVVNTSVHIRNLDGTSGGLIQTELNGDENGIGAPWTGDVKNLAYGLDASNLRPTLLIVDFVGRRLDVYQVPEPATAGLLALGAFGLVTRGRRRTRHS